MEIQDIEHMRQLAGIDDVELGEQIRQLRVGDLVRLTFLAGAGKFETLPVRITTVRRGNFSGELTASASSAQLAALRRGSAVAFTRAHIHSVVKNSPEGSTISTPATASRKRKSRSAKE